MSRPFSLLAVCILTGVLLAGCSGNNSPANSAAGTPSASSSSPAAQPSASGTSSAAPSASPSASASAVPGPSEKAVAPEKSPVGDISDSQAFVKYKSAAGGYFLEVPEGWGRTETGSDVSFISKLDGVKVAVTAADQAPTAAAIKADLEKNGRAVKVSGTKEVSLPNGKAIQVLFESNSEPNAVTGKQVRQDNQAFYYYKNKKLAVLTLWAPLGADNIDQWNRMSASFGWDGK